MKVKVLRKMVEATADGIKPPISHEIDEHVFLFYEYTNDTYYFKEAFKRLA